jgi:16S rRNA (cytosine967-C5)-methyltransferase
MAAQRTRAPLFLRVNLARASREGAAARLAEEGVASAPHPAVRTALRVTGGQGRLAASAAWREGLVEIQDAASQAVTLMVPLHQGDRILDYCAGGGGKILALAARAAHEGLRTTALSAHDADARRMADLPGRARRAGARLRLLSTEALAGNAPFDVIVTDVPCSGSGTWRRTPDAKWKLSPERLAHLCQSQAEILLAAERLAARRSTICYMTCSVLEVENRVQVDRFLAARAGWSLAAEKLLLPSDSGDGLYAAVLTRGQPPTYTIPG